MLSLLSSKSTRSVLDINKLLQRMATNGNSNGVINIANSADQENEAKRAKRLVWVDCEMTGLGAENHRLVEVACIISEADLSMVAEFGPVTITHPPEVLANMSDWCRETFAKNGLLKRIHSEGIPEKEAEMKLLEFLREHTPKGKCPLAGNSVHQDQIFLRRYMPDLAAHLHPYRIVDVSTLKELVNRWYEGNAAFEKMPKKKENHLALDDIRESIEELDFYRKHFFLPPTA